VHEFLVRIIRDGQDAGELLAGDPAVLAELWLRLGASFALMPDSVLPRLTTTIPPARRCVR
jgi:hypothetical protein